MASISFKNVEKTYEGGNTVVPNFNLDIKDKEFLILVGPSGCGKSTTLRMIAGLESVTSGELKIGDTVVNDVAPKDRDIAMVFQSYALYPHMNVYKNLAFSLKIAKVPKDEIDKRVRDVAKKLDIEQYLDRKPKALSGGQRQRVALGRAMVRNPKVFLFDEPLSNLDAKLRNEMRSVISALHKELDTTFVYVTHDQTEAMTMGDRICVMKDGILQQCDTPDNLYSHPCNLFVASFIGMPQMNLIDAEIIEKNKNLYAKFDKYTIPLAERMQKGKIKDYVGKKVVYGIRPENFVMDKSIAMKGDANKLTLKNEFTEMMGSETHMHSTINGKKVIVRVPSLFDIKDEKNVDVYVHTEYPHIFDKDSGELICD